MTQPVIEAGDVTASGNNTAATANTVDYPAYVSGDLLIQFWGGDDDLTADSITAPTGGGNGETLILSQTGSGGGSNSGPSQGIIAWVGDATVGAGSLTWTRGNAEQWVGHTVKVLAGEFDSVTPLSAYSGFSGSSTTSNDIPTPSWTIGADDDGGTVVCQLVTDIAAISATAPTGWTILENTDIGALARALVVRDAATTSSENIASVNFTTTNETSSTVAVVVRPPAGGLSIPVAMYHRKHNFGVS